MIPIRPKDLTKDELLALLQARSDEVVVAWTKAEAEVVQDELDAIEPLTGTCLESALSKLSTALDRNVDKVQYHS